MQNKRLLLRVWARGVQCPRVKYKGARPAAWLQILIIMHRPRHLQDGTLLIRMFWKPRSRVFQH